MSWSWPDTWTPYDETDRTWWRRQLGDGTVLEVFDHGPQWCGWRHVNVDSEGYYEDADVINSSGNYGDPYMAMGSADGYAIGLGHDGGGPPKSMRPKHSRWEDTKAKRLGRS